MTKLALKLPEFGQIDNPPGLIFSGDKANLGAVLTSLLNIVFYIAAFLAFYWLVWGAFAYLMASGQKENLAKARAKITWALVGLLVVFMAYFIARFAAEVFTPGTGGTPF